MKFVSFYFKTFCKSIFEKFFEYTRSFPDPIIFEKSFLQKELN